MLKGVHPLIGPQLLATLARMGHGDLLLVVDRNYPAYAAAVPVHRIDGVGAVAAIEAILTLLPIDDFIDAPMLRMGPVDNPAEITPIQDAVRALVERVEGRSIEIEMLERGAYYQRARQAAAIVATGERQPYGCFGFVKGIVRRV
jgi:L-fucose mutarotase